MNYIVDACGKKRKASHVTCTSCSTSFLKDVRRQRSKKHFCSKSCQKTWAESCHVLLKCEQCDISFKRKKSSLSVSRSGLYFCSRSCKEEAQKLGGLKEIQPSHYGTTYASYRDVAFKKYKLKKVCQRCGFKNKAAICVHHKDRDRTNNLIENLEVLCYNCHAIEHYG